MEIIPAASGMFKLASLPPALDAGLSNEESRRLQKIYNRPPEDYTRVCHTCQKAGSFKARYRDQVVMVECNCREQWILSRRLLASGIGDAYQRYSWQHVTGVPDEALMRVRLYMENLPALLNDGLGLILWSPCTGTGKSLMSYLVLKEALAQGYTGYFTTYTEMLDYHSSGRQDLEARAWFTKTMSYVDVLVIDDLGKEEVFELSTADRLLDQVVRNRTAHGRATIITTNLEPSYSGEDRQERYARAAEKDDALNELRRSQDMAPLAVNAQRARNDIKALTDFTRYQQGLLDLLTETSLIVEVSGTSFRDQRRSQRVDDALGGIRYPVVIR